MIKANELRQGNSVAGGDPVRSIAKVLTVLQDGVEAEYQLVGYGAAPDNPGIGFAKYDELFPIPLSEEWLEMIGWYNLGMGFFAPIGEGNTRRQLNWNGVDCSVKIMDAGAYVITIAENVQFVHQLQNLFFALTGKELTIKQPI